ncbi:MAG: DEAD/DEAH box helicase [Salinivirgaceae bacterium]|nr:DEAD/DEAH box helicase [Salinivirgaceae bacterium]
MQQIKYIIVVFEDLKISTPILNAIENMGFEYCTPIQEATYSLIRSGKDMVGIAQTGTGKTLAYLLPLINDLKFSDQKHPRLLVLVPTRELVLQVKSEAEKLTAYKDVRIEAVYGGTNIKTQKQLVYDGSDLLIATPGRLVDLVMTGVLRMKDIQKVVIDEVDEMLNLGFRGQITSIMEFLPKRRQNLMFSATLTEKVEIIINDFFYEPEKVVIAPHGTPIDKIEQLGYHIPNFFTKINLLEHLLISNSELNKVLVFVKSKKLADLLYDNINTKFPEQFGVIHSNKSQNLRINALNRFKEGVHRVLISTDIMARGLDIHDVSHVINFDMPDEPADYMHRIGRTGRADKVGVAISFINEVEQEFQMEAEKLMGKHILLLPIPEEVNISEKFLRDEKAVPFDKDYLKPIKKKKVGAAYHEKSEKNKQENSGSPSRKRARRGKAVPAKRAKN